MKIDQEKFFEGLGLIKHEFEYKAYGKYVCYEGPDGFFYKMDHFKYGYVIESAENEYEASIGVFEDSDLFDDRLPEDALIEQVHEWIKKYALSDDNHEQ